MSETFGAMLRRFRERRPSRFRVIETYNGRQRTLANSGEPLSQGDLARQAGIDPAYVNRAERSGAIPSRKVVLKLAEVLQLSDAERDRFLFVAGHAPVTDWQAVAEDRARQLQELAGTWLEAAPTPTKEVRTG